MEEKYEHWRNLTDCEHLRAETLQPGVDMLLTIKEIKREKVTSNNGQVEEKPVAHFEENVLPMVLNVTNCKTIEKLFGTGHIYEWTGKKIQIYATTTKVGGQNVPCLRVRNFVPENNKVVYKCSVCEKEISEQIYKGSIAKYGKAYCSKECLETEKNGKDVL